MCLKSSLYNTEIFCVQNMRNIHTSDFTETPANKQARSEDFLHQQLCYI